MAEYRCEEDACEAEPFGRIADLRAHTKQVHGHDLERPNRGALAPGGADEFSDSPLPPDESAPVDGDKPKSLIDRAKDALSGSAKEKPRAAAKKPRAKKSGARVSTARGWAALWKRTGTMLVMSGADVPVGRALVYQSPRAGELLDNLVEGTFVDRAIQPLARKGEAIAELGSLVMLPVLVGLCERNLVWDAETGRWSANPVIEGMLREVLREHLHAMVPLIKAQREEEARNAALVREMGLNPGDDAIGAVLEQMFAPVAEQPAGPEVDLGEMSSSGPNGSARTAAPV